MFNFKIYKRNKLIGLYPCIDHLNIALRYLLNDKKINKWAVEEICYAIEKSGGYYYDDVFDLLVNKGYKLK